MNAPPFTRRLVLALAALALSALAGLAMAAPQVGVGADLLGRWLVGWAAAAAVLAPAAWLVERSIGRGPTRSATRPPRPFPSRRLG